MKCQSAGGGQGIGRAFAHALGEAGAAVAVVDVNGPKAEEVRDELAAKGIRSIAVTADVTKADACNRCTPLGRCFDCPVLQGVQCAALRPTGRAADLPRDVRDLWHHVGACAMAPDSPSEPYDGGCQHLIRQAPTDLAFALAGSMVQQVVEQLGGLDIAINNAGVNRNHAAEDCSEEDWDLTFGLNTKGVFLCCQAEGRHMLKQGASCFCYGAA